MIQSRFEIRKSKKLFKQRFYVATIGGNGEVLQTSEMFPSIDECQTNIAAVREVVSNNSPVVNKTR